MGILCFPPVTSFTDRSPSYHHETKRVKDDSEGVPSMYEKYMPQAENIDKQSKSTSQVRNHGCAMD